MKMTKKKSGLCILACVLSFAAHAEYQVLRLPPLVVGEQLPEGWTGHKPAHLERIEGSHEVVEVEGQTILRLTKNNFDSVLMVQTEVDLPDDQQTLELGIRSRVPEIELPTELPGRNRFRAGVVFLDESGEEISGTFPQIAIGEVQSDWEMATREYRVPHDAVRVRLSFQMLNCTGVWEIQGAGIRVKP
ncbi:MAG: hypothetical protein JJU29_04810 [Verrucomicrobia bacterium]|nr:hypothetical protein [Verrucomicrobiota bacterium]MCH8510271.1 hypothetical protein [Kiritimatiellia bacterium]